MHNVKVMAVNVSNIPGYSIVLDFSGQQEVVMHYRHNGLLFGLLCDGVRLDDLRRWKPRSYGRRAGSKLANTVTYLLKVIDAYLAVRPHSKRYKDSEATVHRPYFGVEEAPPWIKQGSRPNYLWG